MSNNLIGATLATFTVTLSAAVTEPVDVAWSTRDGTAKAGTDYEAANGVVTFLPGETAKQVQVTVYGQEDLAAPDKNFFIELSPPTNAVLGVTFIEVVITIDEEDGVAVLSLVVPQGKRGLKGDPGLSAYEHAVLMGQFTGTVEEWMAEIGDASQAAERAEGYASDAAESVVLAEQKAEEANQIAATVTAMNDGQEYFLTQTSLLASTPTETKKVAKALDTKKVWMWQKPDANPGTWIDTGLSELDQAKAYTDSTSLKRHSLIGNVNLNTFITGGLYFQSISANATAANNYPAHAQNIQSEITVIPMSANTIMQIIKASGVISTRLTYNGGASWNAWVTSLGQGDYTALSNLTSTLESKLSKRLEWFISGSDGVVSYNKDTKTLSWNRPLIASYNLATTRRINIAAGSVTFAGTGFEVLFLDTTSLPADGNVTVDLIASCLKIASYNNPAATAFTDKITQIPIAKLNPQGEIVACAGFLTLTSSASKVQKDTFAYNKIADRISIYLPALNGNLIKYLMRHDVKPFDGTSSQSQLDIWRLERAIECNSAQTELQEIVTYGEWAFTMRESAYPADHVGGVHGDELLTSAVFIVDGVYKDPLTWTGVGEAKEIQMLIKSVIYRLNTQTPICNHYMHYTITKDGIKLYQEIETVVTSNFDRLWLAMMPVNRVAANSVQVTTRDIRKGVVNDVSASGFPITYTPFSNQLAVNVSGNKYSTEVKVANVIGALPTADAYVSNDAAYNKVYFSAIGSASSGVNIASGTKMSWTTNFKVDAI